MDSYSVSELSNDELNEAIDDETYMRVFYLYEVGEYDIDVWFAYDVLYKQDGPDNAPIYTGYESTIYKVTPEEITIYVETGDTIDII